MYPRGQKRYYQEETEGEAEAAERGQHKDTIHRAYGSEWRQKVSAVRKASKSSHERIIQLCTVTTCTSYFTILIPGFRFTAALSYGLEICYNEFLQV